MISGASATGHEIGGTLGIAIYASIATAASGGIFVGPAAAAGIAHAFLIAGYVALGTSVAALVLLPAAKTFLPKLRLNPRRSPPTDRFAAAPARVARPPPAPPHDNTDRRHRKETPKWKQQPPNPTPAQPGARPWDRCDRIVPRPPSCSPSPEPSRSQRTPFATATATSTGPPRRFTSNGYAITMKTVDISQAPSGRSATPDSTASASRPTATARSSSASPAPPTWIGTSAGPSTTTSRA